MHLSIIVPLTHSSFHYAARRYGTPRRVALPSSPSYTVVGARRNAPRLPGQHHHAASQTEAQQLSDGVGGL